MNGVDYSQKFSRQNEIYRNDLDNSKRNYEEQVDNLKKTHESRVSTQSAEHKKQVDRLEKDYVSNIEGVDESQRKALLDKSGVYEKSLNDSRKEFNEERKDNLRSWNKKFDELKGTFNNNLTNTSESNTSIQKQLSKNYDDNIESVRKKAHGDLNTYIDNNKVVKKESDIQFRTEKNKIIADNQKRMADLSVRESEKRNALFNGGIKDVQEYREKQVTNYLDLKNQEEQNFKNQIAYTNDKIEKEIIQREDRSLAAQQADNRKQNKAFSEKIGELAENYNKDVREIQYRTRAEKISQSDENKAIKKRYDQNQSEQYQQKVDTHLNERQLVESKFQDKLKSTVDSYQSEIRESNIENGERMSELQAKMTESRRTEKFKDSMEKENLIHKSRVALKHEKDQSTETNADMLKQNNLKVQNLKQSFSRSLASVQEQSKQNFDDTKAEMLQDKKELSQRLHEQNSKQAVAIRQVYSDKMQKTIDGYEQKVNALELQNKMIIQNSNSMLRDVKRNTSAEIERQRKLSKEAMIAEVNTQKLMGKDKENSLLKKIDSMQTEFTKKMNEETLRNRNKNKDIQFELNQTITSEANRYQDIIDQNSKFFARELQRVQMASGAEKERIVQQYEERIEQLQNVYRDQTNEMKEFNKINNSTAES